MFRYLFAAPLKIIQLVVFVPLMLSSCDDLRPRAEILKPPSTVLSCADYAKAERSNGNLYNNVWNKHAAKDYPWQQCIERFNLDNQDYPGWSWHWPDLNKQTIYAYPQINMGSSPWDPNNNEQGFPLPLERLKHLSLKLDMQVQGSGEQNVASTMWIVNSADRPTKADPAMIEAEIMLWTYRSAGHMQPAGNKVAEVNLSGFDWEVWAQRNWADASQQNSHKWTYLAFRLKGNHLVIDLDLLDFLQWAISNDYISSTNYVADVQSGNEIQSGQGFTVVKQFTLDVELNQ